MKTQFTPIAMRCTKEQFKAIETKLEGKVEISKSPFEWFIENKNYLTNDFNCEKKVKFTGTFFQNRTVYETWDEATFLKACGIDPEVYTVSKDFILEAHESACSTLKTKIENQFPELFPKVELEIGKWYKNNDINYEKSIACVVELDKENKREFMGYGFDCDGDFRPLADDCVWGSNSWTLATKEEVETALIAEAKRRGFEDGVIYLSPKLKIKRTFSGEFNYYSDNNSLSDKNSGMIFNKGVWAEIISEPIELSLEQIAEKFGVDVSQIKIIK